MSTIFLNGQSYSFEQIKQYGPLLVKEKHPIHHSSFALIQQWLQHAETFNFTTSGSTGLPKNILLSRRQLRSSAEGTISALSLTSAEHILVCMNTAFIGGAMLIIRALLIDATITLLEPSGNPLHHIADDHPYTFASFAPIQLFPILENKGNERQKLNRFKQILVGGGAIDPSLEKELSKLQTKVFHTYGMTETVSHIGLKEIGRQEHFTPLPEVKLEQDNRGCLRINCPATNHEWVQTNDIVTLYPDQSFTLLGRADDVINSGGIKVWPEKIEQVIRSIAGTDITNMFISAVPDAKLGQQVIAILESPHDAEYFSPLSAHLGSSLSRYEIPKQFYTLTSFSYTQTGKINKPETLKMIGL